MEQLDKKENKIVFKADIGVELANAIRKYVNEIFVLAIDEIEIVKNDSPLYDETVAHRLGLVPLASGKSVKEGTTGKLKLSQKKEGVVYSGELQGSIDVVYDKIPITTLDKGQEIEIVAEVAAGKGSEHSKFSPGLIFYRNASEIELDKKFLDEVKKTCPGAEIKEKGNKIIIKDNQANEICDVVEGIALKNDAEFETKIEDDLVVSVESFGQMKVEDIFKNSIDSLKKDLKEFSKQVK